MKPRVKIPEMSRAELEKFAVAMMLDNARLNCELAEFRELCESFGWKLEPLKEPKPPLIQ